MYQRFTGGPETGFWEVGTPIRARVLKFSSVSRSADPDSIGSSAFIGQDGCLAPQHDAGTSLSYFNLSQINVRAVFLPVAGSVEGSVVSVKWLPSNL